MALVAGAQLWVCVQRAQAPSYKRCQKGCLSTHHRTAPAARRGRTVAPPTHVQAHVHAEKHAISMHPKATHASNLPHDAVLTCSSPSSQSLGARGSPPTQPNVPPQRPAPHCSKASRVGP